MRILLIISSFIIGMTLHSQPSPCEDLNPDMTPFCEEACIICDIDGFTGRHQSNIIGEAPGDFVGACTFNAHNMQWIAFIAGSQNMQIELQVSNCEENRGLEVGLYASIDCQNYRRVSNCFGGVAGVIGPGDSGVIVNNEPLTIGQYYYLVMDGARGDNCDWTFNVLSGTTALNPLSSTRPIEGDIMMCTDEPSLFSTDPEVGATLFLWTLDNNVVGNINSPELELSFDEPGAYLLCVQASNACDQAAPTCDSLFVNKNSLTNIEDRFCEGSEYIFDQEVFTEPGIYPIEYIDSNGCDSIIILELNEVAVSTHNVTTTICEGDFLTIGDQPFGNQGSFEVNILTEDLCDSIVFLDLQLVDCTINSSYVGTDPLCYNENSGTVEFNIETGIPGFEYRWQHLETSITGQGTINSLNSPITISNLASGTYVIAVSDDMDNDNIMIVTLENPDQLISQIDDGDNGGFTVSCYDSNDGILSVDVQGGTPGYSYLWSNAESTTMINNLVAGTYSVTVTDDVGCTVVNSFVADSPDPIMADIQFLNSECESVDSGQILIDNITGGIGNYNILINNIPSQDSLDGLSPGDYNVRIEDENNCMITFDGQLTAPQIPVLFVTDAPFSVALGDSLLIEVATNSITIQDINWSAMDQLSCDDCLLSSILPLNSQVVEVSVTSIDGCTTSLSFPVEVVKTRAVYVPNVMYEQDSQNNTFRLFGGIEVNDIAYDIYDRWGNVVFSGSGTDGWDGRINGKELVHGIYTWVATIDFIDGFQELRSGSVMLIK